jgi:polar amino acid transport system substrate-binding protein
MYKRVLLILGVTILVVLGFNTYSKNISSSDPWKGVDLYGKLSQEQLEWLAGEDGIRVGFSDSLTPQIQNGESNSPEGILVDFIDFLVEPLGVAVEYVPVFHDEAEELLRSGELDGMLAVSTGELPNDLIYSSPILPAKGALFLKSALLSTRNKEAFQEAHFIVTDDQPLMLEGANIREASEVTRVKSVEEGMNLLKTGQYDGIFGNEGALYHYLVREEMETEYEKYPMYTYEKNVVLMTERDTPASEVLMAAVYYLNRDQVIPALQLKWYGISYELQETTLFGNIGILLFIMVAGVLFVFFLFYYSNKSLYEELSDRMEMVKLSRNELQATFDGVDYLMAEIDEESRVGNMNLAFENYVGLHRSQIHREDVKVVMGLNPSATEKLQKAIEETFGRENTQQLEIIEGRKILEFRFFPIKDSRERVLKLLMMVVDVTAQRSVERQMIQDNKMIAIGQLAAGVAHELRNPLGIIRNYCFLLKSAGRENPEIAGKATESIEKSVERAGKIIENLLNFSRSGEKELEEVDVKEEMEGVFVFYEKSLEAKGIRFHLLCESGLMLKIVPESLEMILMNLVSNAADSISTGGNIFMEAREESGQVFLEVRDDGAGISEEIRGEIFNPFFTTKKHNEGNGLGLYLVYNEVMKMNGSIEVESEKGKETIFRIVFSKTGG